MSLIDVINEVLTTGILPLAVERQLHQLLQTQQCNETDLIAIDQLIEALCTGSVRSVI